MSKTIPNAFIGLLLIALSGFSAEAGAQATDVDCDKCVDSGDIAGGAVNNGKIADKAVNSRKLDAGAVTNGKIADKAVNSRKIDSEAVTTGKIADGAVTVDKVGPPLKNAIGTFCPPGQSVVGMDVTGNLVCEAVNPLYFPSGPQVDVKEGTLVGWQQCYQDAYNNSGTTLTSILAQCDGSKLLLACKFVDDTSFRLLAAAPREDVLFDTGIDATTTHTANGSEWYFSDDWSWGFAAQGDTVNKGACDADTSGANDKRLCWQTESSAIEVGSRCGVATSLSAAAGWERYIFHAD